MTLSLFSLIAAAQAADDRNLIIQKQLDCVDQHLSQQGKITWNDVCDIAPAANASLDQQEEDIYSQNPPATAEPPVVLADNLNSPWSYEVSSEMSSIKYHEQVAGTDFVRETGDMEGINGIATYHPPPGTALNSQFMDVYRMEGMFNFGEVNYRGGFENEDGSTTPDTFYGINDYMLEGRGIAGKDLYFDNQSLRLTPYIGLGYRFLFDSLSENKPGGYNRVIQYLYAPIGNDTVIKLTPRWSVDINTEYDIFIQGWVASYLSSIGEGNLWNTQTSGFGLRGSLKLEGTFDRYNFFVEPFVRYWKIHATKQASSTPFTIDGQEYVVIGEEPDNSSLEIGTKIGIEF